MKSSGGDAEYIALLCDLVFAIRSMHHRRRRITANHGVYHVCLQVYERQPAQAMVGWTRHRQRFLGFCYCDSEDTAERICERLNPRSAVS